MRKYPEKRVKAYAFRQFQRTVEKERLKSIPKSGRVKEKVVSGYGRVREQVITYKKQKVSRIVYRDDKGRFTKAPYSKIAPKGEKAEKIAKKFFGESKYYRASVYVEVAWHSNKKHGRPNYFWFGIVVYDKPEKIDMKQLKEDLIKMLEKELHYNRNDLDWIDWEHPALEYPKPYPANRSDRYEEKWSKTKK